MGIESNSYLSSQNIQKRQCPVILDVESSGFGRGSYPIEIGVALDDGQTHCMIIQPHSSWQHWDANAEKLHGITRDLIENNGKSITEVATWLNDCLKGQAVYSDAWGNDSSWLALLFEYAHMSQLFKLKPLYGLLSENQIACWHSTKNDVIEALGCPRHRASHDALILQKTFCKTDVLTG